MCVCMLSRFSHVWLFATPWTAVCQAPLSMGSCRQEYWSGLPVTFSRESSRPRVQPTSFTSNLHGQVGSLPLVPPGKHIFPGAQTVISACHAGDLGFTSGPRRFPGKGSGNSLQYSCLKNSMGSQSQRRLSN